MHFVYIVRCADGTLYTGYARDPGKRAELHNAGRGARYTAGRRPVSLVYAEAFESVGDALKREHQVKRLSRALKEGLIATRGALRHAQDAASGSKRAPRQAQGVVSGSNHAGR